MKNKIVSLDILPTIHYGCILNKISFPLVYKIWYRFNTGHSTMFLYYFTLFQTYKKMIHTCNYSHICRSHIKITSYCNYSDFLKFWGQQGSTITISIYKNPAPLLNSIWKKMVFQVNAYFDDDDDFFFYLH